MSRLVLVCSVIAIFCAARGDVLPLSAAMPAAQAQSTAASSINNEPHHKRLLYTNDLRLWDVTLPAGQSTSPFVYEYDVATVVIAPFSAPSPNARGSISVAEHTGAPATSRIENSGTTEYRALEIENMREGGWPAAQPFTAPGSSVLKESRAFTIYDVVLKADSPETMHQHAGSTIVVLMGGTLQQGGIGGTDPVRISQPGQWLSLPRFQAHALARVGSTDAHALEIEVR